MPSTNIKITATDKSKTAFNSAKRSVNALTGSVGLLKGALLGYITVASAKAFVNFANTQRDMAEQIGKNADRLNMTTRDLQTFRFAMEQAGESSETADKTLVKFARAIDDARNGVTTALDEFDRLGISIRNTDGSLKGQTQLLYEVSDAWSRNDDAVRKIGSANLLFGRTGKVMINMLSQGTEALEHQRKAYLRSGGVIKDNYIRNAEDATDALNRLKHVIIGNATRLTGMLDPAIIAVAESLDRFKGIDPIKTMSVKRLEDEYSRLNEVVLGLFDSLSEVSILRKLGIADSKEEIKQEMKSHLLHMEKLKSQMQLRAKQASAVNKIQKDSTKNKDEEVKNIFMITKAQQKMYASGLTLAFEASAKRIEQINQISTAQQQMYASGITLAEEEIVKQEELRAEIVEFRRTEEQQITADIMSEHERRAEIITEYLRGEGADNIEKNELILANARDTSLKLQALDQQKKDNLQSLNQEEKDNALATSKEMIKSMGSANQSWFQANKALSIAETLMATHTAATKALTIQPPWVGMAYAGTITGLGMANVNRIKNTKYEARAMGGDVNKGQSYIVGERGQELFTPNQSGTITPNNKMGGTNVTFNIQTNDSAGFDDLLQDRRGMIVSMINRASNENGQGNII